MNEVIAQEVLNHQLNGIMLHAGMLDLFITLDLPKLERIQERQLIDEIKTHVRTKQEFFHETGKMLKVKPDTQTDTTVSAVETKTEKAALARQAVRKWRAWEVKTASMYTNACEKEPECKLWKRLRRDVDHEIRCIDRILCRLSTNCLHDAV